MIQLPDDLELFPLQTGSENRHGIDPGLHLDTTQSPFKEVGTQSVTPHLSLSITRNTNEGTNILYTGKMPHWEIHVTNRIGS